MTAKYPDFLLAQMDATLAEFPNVATRTLAKRIFSQNKKFFNNLEQVRSALKRRRGNSGKSSMKTDHKRENGKSGWVPQVPPSQAKAWIPHYIKGPQRIAVISDVHIPFHCEKSIQRWYEDAQEYEPSIILINGDLIDFYRLSRFEKDPNMRSTAFEIDQVHEFLDWLQHNFEADIIFKEGNHDERWRKYLFNFAPELAQFSQFELKDILELDSRKIEYVTDKRIVMAGKLAILHGHETHGSSAVNPAKSLATQVSSSALQGHCHRTSEFLEHNMLGEWLKCYSTGSLCELNPEFSRINRWNNGYAFVDVHEDNSFDVRNVVLD